MHDIFDNVIVEAGGAGVTQRECILIPDVGYAGVSLPLANVEGSTLYYVHTEFALLTGAPTRAVEYIEF